MKIAILHHPSDSAAALTCRAHLALLRARGHAIEACSTDVFLVEQAPIGDARIVLLILSAALVEWWTSAPYARTLEARGAEALALLIPVRFRACEIPAALQRVVGLPAAPSPPIDALAHPDAGWTEVAKGIRTAVAKLEGGAP